MSGCHYTWNGLTWVLTQDDCPDGSLCAPPARNGFYIGEVVVNPCITVGVIAP